MSEAPLCLGSRIYTSKSFSLTTALSQITAVLSDKMNRHRLLRTSPFLCIILYGLESRVRRRLEFASLKLICSISPLSQFGSQAISFLLVFLLGG
jgi:hypothetical protein